MEIFVRLFARGRELAGRSQCTLSLESGATVEQALAVLRTQFPPLAELTVFMTAVNMTYVEGDSPLRDGDELAIIPPVSGG
ncbi:MAG: molybdopterin converting factor subunit 1 [Calditrichaeota bacterium]|nr:molybdopterin converting factor subunit 1 [Calditrichota bacterium]